MKRRTTIADSEKDWKACVQYCVGQAEKCVMNARIELSKGNDQEGFNWTDAASVWRRRGLAAALHAFGEGWLNIRKRMDLQPDEEMWLHRWTT